MKEVFVTIAVVCILNCLMTKRRGGAKVERNQKKDERSQAKGQIQPLPILSIIVVSLSMLPSLRFWRTLWNSSSLAGAALIPSKVTFVNVCAGTVACAMYLWVHSYMYLNYVYLIAYFGASSEHP